MANIYEDEDISIVGTAKADTIVASGQADSYVLYGLKLFGMEILGGAGNDDINPGIMQDRMSIAWVFGGDRSHDPRLPQLFDKPAPYKFDGNDTLHIGQGIWGDGGNGHDRFFSHGPSFEGATAPRAWMDWQNDDLIFDNTDKSHDTRGAFRADGSGVKNGFEVVDIHFARHFTSAAGVNYAEVNGFSIHSFSKVPAIREQHIGVVTYDTGDDPNHHDLFVRVDKGETARQAVSEFLHDHALAGATDQWGGDQFLF